MEVHRQSFFKQLCFHTEFIGTVRAEIIQLNDLESINIIHYLHGLCKTVIGGFPVFLLFKFKLVILIKRIVSECMVEFQCYQLFIGPVFLVLSSSIKSKLQWESHCEGLAQVLCGYCLLLPQIGGDDFWKW